MYLEELILENFKSFGERTRIPLRNDFTAITGPNGSGKSNILDAIQFALGLGHVSDVRAHRLTDLIHTTSEGSPSLPREAVVTVIINNDDKTLSRDQVANAAGGDISGVDRIEIRRRIRQTKNNSYSYYYIEDNSVNLGDIRDLMAQGGVTDDRFNIVPQGDITELINQTPMARRSIIDEIAGVAEFEAKKEQAEAELETVRERIEEIELRIEEKSETLEQLADDREEALAYQELAEERSEYERYHAAAKLAKRRDRLETVTGEIESLEEEVQTARHELAEREERARRLEEDIEDLTEEIDRKGGEQQQALQAEIESLRSTIGKLEGRIDEKRERIQELHSTRRDAELQLDRKRETLEGLESDEQDIKVKKADITGDIVDYKQELAAVTEEIDALDAEQRMLNDRLRECEHIYQEALDVQDAVQRELDRLNDEARRRDRERESLADDIEELQARRDSREEDKVAIDREMDRVKGEIAELTEQIAELESESQSLADELSTLDSKIESTKQRFRDLQKQTSGRGQFPQSVAQLMGAGIEGIFGPVATLGDVPEERHAEATEAAGGGRLANVVVESPTVAETCIEHLKKRNAGRATFLPLTEFSEHGLPPLPDHPGVVDFARRLVEYDERFAGIFSYVLGSTLVVEDMETARALMGEYRMVTLAGDVVERSGAMRGGSGRETSYRFGGERDRLRRLGERIESLESDREELREQKASVDDDLDAAKERQRTRRDDLRQLERERTETVEGIEVLEGQIGRKRQQLESIKEQREATTEKIEAVTNRAAAADAAVEAIDAQIRDIKKALADTELGKLTDRRSELQDAIAELESRVDELDASLNEIGLEKQSTNARIEELTETVASTQNEIADKEDEIDDLEQAIEEEEAEIANYQDQIAELEDDLSELKARRESTREELAEARDEVNEARQRVNEIERELGPLRDERDRLEWEIEGLAEETDPVDEDEIPDLEVVNERIESLTEKMEAMEPVNHKAIDHYDRLNDEVEDLKTNVDELDTERGAIHDRINSYETQKREAFLEAYNAIDEEFRSVFRTLSGGTAALELENEEDPFDGGLLMTAQPEDKFVGSLEQLSGGEKSLTAISLIFAIQRYRPAPFYALDEIDAFLDAANLDRIGDLLESHREDGQFIVVSHHADLLERADRVIGVTMPNESIGSRVSGVQLAGEVSADD